MMHMKRVMRKRLVAFTRRGGKVITKSKVATNQTFKQTENLKSMVNTHFANG